MTFATKDNSQGPDPPPETQIHYSPTRPVQKFNLGHGWTLPIMHRLAWGGAAPPRASLRPLHMPVRNIRLTDTGTSGCNETHECIRIIKQFQRSYMDLGFPDQPFNFLIGGEGTVFVGRGWYKRAMLVPRNTIINETCVEIAYIGKFATPGPPTDMLFTALDLIKYGVKNNNVDPFFKIFEFTTFSLNY